ncbi:hypothetical protein [Spirosoma validum]|uniref:DUF3592 domain-containing protein n=1 Tax=Spirosoma validum TaxID=2771355 RepID=A0A927B2Z7_9BACT|nr:hypothetical protein [Spirosoma validum]MBD2754383.1 hypothetical protein [Spirosoma validum]
MLKQLLSSLGRIYSFVMSLIITAILCVITWGFWEYYQDARLQKQFMLEGQRISVLVDKGEQKQRSWRDILGNSTYLTFQYRGKAYTTRFVMDSGYVGSGDRVHLLYHPTYDAFRQPRNEVRYDQSNRKSRLVEWSTVRSFTGENKLLFFCLLLTSVSFFLLTGVIVTIVPLGFLQDIARLVLTVELLLAAIFFTYDTYQYFQYYQHLKANGHEVAVQVLDTHRRAVGNSSGRNNHSPLYTYEATIQYQQQERVIPISEDEYETLKPKDTLKAYYEASVNDFMSVDYPPDYLKIVIPVFFLFISILLLRSTIGSRQQKQPAAPVK